MFVALEAERDHLIEVHQQLSLEKEALELRKEELTRALQVRACNSSSLPCPLAQF